jgi:hypothetical protein
MLAEKFILLLESFRRSGDRRHHDGAPQVMTSSPHVPIKLPANKSRAPTLARSTDRQKPPLN